jgi:hypothetical protein
MRIKRPRGRRTRGDGRGDGRCFAVLAVFSLTALSGSVVASCGLGAAGELATTGDDGGAGGDIGVASSAEAATGDHPPATRADAAIDMAPDATAGAVSPSIDATSPPPADDAAESESGADVEGVVDAADAATSAPDTGTGDSGGTCDFGGTWAKRLIINVGWAPQGITGIIIAPGTGTIKQWVKSTRVRSGDAATDTSVVCGIALPDFQGTAIAGGETYGVRFPDSMFDSGDLPPDVAHATLVGSTAGASYTTTATAALLGLTLADATTAPWPSTITTEVDADDDGNPGVTADVAQGTFYSDIPLDIRKSKRADRLYLAIRQVTELTATFTDCDHASGTVTIPQIPNTPSGKYAIDSHVIGCGWAGSTTNCTSAQANFVDSTQPVFTPSGYTQFTSVRIPTGGTCADVRAALP